MQADPYPLVAGGHSSMVAICRPPKAAGCALLLQQPAESAKAREEAMRSVSLVSSTCTSSAHVAARGVPVAVLSLEACWCLSWPTDAVRRAMWSSHASARPLAMTTVVYTPLGRDRKASAGESGA